MRRQTILDILRNARIGLTWWDLVDAKIVWLTEVREFGEKCYGVEGGIGAFTEDARALYSTLALAESGVLVSKG